MRNRKLLHRLVLAIMAPASLVVLCGMYSFDGSAMPPSPELEAKIASGELAEPYFLKNIADLHAKGVCVSEAHNAPLATLIKHAAYKSSGGPENSGQAVAFRALAILVEFSDDTNRVAASFFDTLLFADQPGKVRHYYKEVSYGALDMTTVDSPSVIGWKTAPQTYAYYCNGQNGTGSYPHNSQRLCEDLVDLIDPQVDFSDYDNDGDGYVDAVVIIHSGRGAELTGSANDIWSHKWGITPRLRDGVRISSYTIQPEYWYAGGDMTCGVYAHELGHAFGLPDLYDTDYSSWGVGKWCLMASGAWNGAMGNSPSHPCAWSREQMGFSTPTIPTSNTTNTPIPSVESGGQIFKLWTSGVPGSEYFLVENRQKTGYDSYLPSSGLLIWHIDDSKSSNTSEWYPGQPYSSHYQVALVQADTLWHLEHKTNTGDAGDPWPGSVNKTAFSPITTPSSSSYAGANTFVAVSNISPSSTTMSANFTVSLLAGVDDDDPPLPNSFAVRQNYPNPFNPNTKIGVEIPTASVVRLTIYNVLGQSVRVLADDRYAAGLHLFEWDGRDNAGRPVSSGVYFYEVTADDQRDIKTMALLK